MKDKRIRMYLIFQFDQKAPKIYENLSIYEVTKSGDEFIQLGYTELTNKRYVDFDKVLERFLENCKKDQKIIKQLLNEVDGKFNIEIVPEISYYSSTPSIVLNHELFDFIKTLGNKFGYLEIDTNLI